jgi:hypothetical protein
LPRLALAKGITENMTSTGVFARAPQLVHKVLGCGLQVLILVPPSSQCCRAIGDAQHAISSGRGRANAETAKSPLKQGGLTFVH